MSKGVRWLAAGIVAAESWSCTQLVGLDKDYHLTDGGAGGAGGTATPGSSTTTSSGGGGPTGTGAVGKLGEPCAPVGALACGGNAQKSKLICGPDGTWATNGTCDGDTLCNTATGGDAGTCKPVVGPCSVAAPSDVVCDGTKRVKCGPDRVTTEEVEACLYGCSGGQCRLVPPSCAGLPTTCGPKGDESCCVTKAVPGGTYNRSNDAQYPAKVSDFWLDRFEVTVGRFRAFVNAYPSSKPVPGAGAHPLIPGSGWDSAWDGQLLDTTQFNCSDLHHTWTDLAGANENLPMNCISWYEAFAFCAWDGGRLPTEAEWNYAAAGGGEQRLYPWSNPPASTAIDATYAVYGTVAVVVVGSKPAGDGKWGQADLAGSVWEWNLDAYVEPYLHPTPDLCTDCANTQSSSTRVVRGGGWYYDASNQFTSLRRSDNITGHGDNGGVRCARTP